MMESRSKAYNCLPAHLLSLKLWSRYTNWNGPFKEQRYLYLYVISIHKCIYCTWDQPGNLGTLKKNTTSSQYDSIFMYIIYEYIIIIKGSLAQKLPIYERHLSKVKSSRVVLSRVESSRVESSRIVSSRVESSRVESSRIVSRRVESSRVESSRVVSSRIESSRVGQVE